MRALISRKILFAEIFDHIQNNNYRK